MDLIQKNAQRWASAKLTRGPEFTPVAKRLTVNQARYKGITTKTGVPWFVIAVIHEREAGYDPQFTRNIANGETWNRQTKLVPKGRGPFGSFEETKTGLRAALCLYWKDITDLATIIVACLRHTSGRVRTNTKKASMSRTGYSTRKR